MSLMTVKSYVHHLNHYEVLSNRDIVAGVQTSNMHLTEVVI